jgi:hypothetical protein
MSDDPKAPRNPGGIRPDPDGPPARRAFSVDDALAALQAKRQQATEARGNGRGGPLGRAAEPEAESEPEPRQGNGNGNGSLAHREYQDGIPPPADLAEIGGDYDDDGDGEAGAAEAADDGEAAEAEPSFSVTIGGEQRQVGLSELLNGYMRTQDYTRKSSETSAQQRQFADAYAQLSTMRGQLEQRLAQFTTAASREFEAPTDWVELARTNPMEWAEKRARYDQLQEAKAEEARLGQLRQQEDFARKQEMLRVGNDVLMQWIPEWRDPAKRTALQAELKEFARSVGYSDQELNSEILDPRYVVVFADAMKFRKMNSRRVQVPPAQDPPRRPLGRGGQAPATGATRAQQAAAAQFSAAPTVNNALAMLKTKHKLN